MILDLRGAVKDYSWGTDPLNSPIKDFLLEDINQYAQLAELWFGVHPGGSAFVQNTGSSESLEDYLRKINKEDLKPEFLAKILSVGSPLSIQIHPDKLLAPGLHKSDPKNYPDKNPKPEMAIALTELILFYGIKEIDEIISLVYGHPAFQAINSNLCQLKSQSDLRPFIKSIYSLSTEHLRLFSSKVTKNSNQETDHIILKVLEKGDILDPGIVFAYIMNIEKIQPGEAIYIKPLIPHAYISGNLFECMLTSDNVIRGGLTTKFIDTNNFIDLVDLSNTSSELKPFVESANLKKFTLPECDFQIISVSGETKIILDSSFCILVLISGLCEIKDRENVHSISAPCSKLFILNKDENLELSFLMKNTVAFLIHN